MYLCILINTLSSQTQANDTRLSEPQLVSLKTWLPSWTLKNVEVVYGKGCHLELIQKA